MRTLSVRFARRFRTGWHTFCTSPPPVRRLGGSLVVIAGAFLVSVVTSTFDWAPSVAVSFYSVIIGVLINLYIGMSIRVKALEKAVSSGAIKELVATMTDGRSIWIRDDQHTYEAAPPRNGRRPGAGTERN